MPHLIQEASFLAKEVGRCSSAFERVKQFAVILQENPDDPQANLVMGRFLCFVKNDWAAGLPLMGHGYDAALKSVVNEEINGKSKTPSGRIALGNSWWDLSTTAPAEEKLYYQERARYWYLKGIADAFGSDNGRLRRDLSGRIETIPTDTAEVHIVSRVSGTEYVDIYSDEIRWRSSARGSIGNRINQVSLGNFDAADLKIIKNCGVTWFMPAIRVRRL